MFLLSSVKLYGNLQQEDYYVSPSSVKLYSKSR